MFHPVGSTNSIITKAMLQAETAAVAARFGYVSPISSQEEYDEQYPAEVNYDPKAFDIDQKETHPKTDPST